MIQARQLTAVLTMAIATLLPLACSREAAKGDQTEARGSNVLEQMLRNGTLTVGYAGYPPYLTRDPLTGEISGYSVELLETILAPLDVTIQWRETTWDTMKQDVLGGKFDLMVEPIFMTIPRSAELGFTRPYAYFGYAVPLVRADERRFNRLADLDDPNITIAITQGVTDQEFAERNLTEANVKLIPGTDISITLTEVITGKADAALADVPSILNFLEAHPGQAKALFIDDPPASTPAAFMTRPGEVEFINFLDSAMLFLEANGIFEELDAQYSLPSLRERRELVPGRGLSN